jgi:lysyl-tRNA synthetase class 2
MTELQAVRAQKRDAILELLSSTKLQPSPFAFISGTQKVATLRKVGDTLTIEQLSAEPPIDGTLGVGAVGRVTNIRTQGKIAFLDLVDEGDRIQLFIRQTAVSEITWKVVQLLDLGDHIGVRGRLMKTRAGELSIEVTSLMFFSKAVSPLPDKHWGLTDIEVRHRQRYLDLAVNPQVVKTFQTRAKVIQAVREFMHRQEFMEVETPMFHPVSGGANARPFTTHHNALDTDFNLRIAPELYLKRLIVGGFRKVYELNRNFRNEGIDRTHNPEFTMLECYEAYADYVQAMYTVETLFKFVCIELGQTTFKFQEHEIDFTNWERISLDELVSLRHNRRYSTDEELMHIFDNEIEPTLIQPTIVFDFPASVSPLAKVNPHNSRAERFEVYIGGMELANAFSELTDSEEQLRRFEAQVANHADESREVDHDYIRALSYGMPPTAGIGVGIDRMVMLFTNQPSIREVILFPSLRKEAL